MWHLAMTCMKVTDSADATELVDAQVGGISFRDVHFGYRSDRPILKGLTLEVIACRCCIRRAAIMIFLHCCGRWSDDHILFACAALQHGAGSYLTSPEETRRQKDIEEICRKAGTGVGGYPESNLQSRFSVPPAKLAMNCSVHVCFVAAMRCPGRQSCAVCACPSICALNHVCIKVWTWLVLVTITAVADLLSFHMHGRLKTCS